MGQTAPYTPAIGDRVKIGGGKAIWIIEDFPTLTSGANVAALTREGSNGYVNTTADPARLKPAPQEAGK
ncbi:hypothetical protein [Arthrobacter sp. MAHUQ-56]